MSFPKFVNMTKNIPFFPILHVFAPLNDVHAYIAWSWKTTLITWFFFFFFLRGWYPTSNTSGPRVPIPIILKTMTYLLANPCIHGPHIAWMHTNVPSLSKITTRFRWFWQDWLDLFNDACNRQVWCGRMSRWRNNWRSEWSARYKLKYML